MVAYMQVLESFAEALSAELAQTGESDHQVAKRIGVSQPTISQLCNGDRNPTLTTAAKLMAAYPRLLLWFACYVYGMTSKAGKAP